jgi:hypothetical protein
MNDWKIADEFSFIVVVVVAMTYKAKRSNSPAKRFNTEASHSERIAHANSAPQKKRRLGNRQKHRRDDSAE